MITHIKKYLANFEQPRRFVGVGRNRRRQLCLNNHCGQIGIGRRSAMNLKIVYIRSKPTRHFSCKIYIHRGSATNSNLQQSLNS
ncbi:hypothetical protein [Alphabaculovirus myunipunctae]|uniref:Uncharacterized protein n=1 Tax=Mythimna unipuncta nucleopolyhedrovirus TaxID=447897 RepID=A0A2K9VS62_9ABAC|nr:hypothetical protein [Mythimna unipuncta nucleopolyhedrovirus]AUV65299.1 hypothetical protein [Mythimna unipuncta nucleopolyhedrovirus]